MSPFDNYAPVEFDYDCSFVRIPFYIGKGWGVQVDRSDHYTWHYDTRDADWRGEDDGDALVSAYFSSIVSGRSPQFNVSRWYKFNFTKAYAVNEITFIHDNWIARIYDQEAFDVLGTDDTTDRTNLSDYSYNRLVESKDHRRGKEDTNNISYMGTWENVNVPSPYTDNEGGQHGGMYKLTVRLINDIKEYKSYIIDCTRMQSTFSNIKLMHVDYRAAHEGDYTISSADMTITTAVVEDASFNHPAGQMRLRIKPCVPIPVKARGVAVRLRYGAARDRYATVSGFRTTHVSPEYTEVAATTAFSMTNVVEASLNNPISIRGNLQDHLTVKASLSVVTHDLFLMASTSTTYLSTIKQWFLSHKLSTLTYIDGVSKNSSVHPSSKILSPHDASFGSRTILNEATTTTVLPTHRIQGNIERADKTIGFVDVVQDNHRRVRVLAFSTSHFWHYDLENAGRLLAPFSTTSSSITSDWSFSDNTSTTVTYGPIARGKLGAGASTEEKCTVTFGRTPQAATDDGGERDYDSDNDATAYENSDGTRRTYWQCPKDGPLIVFFAQAIPADGKWHGQTRTSYKLQCKRIRLKSFVNAPRSGAIYGVDKLDRTTRSTDWKKIHEWSGAGPADSSSKQVWNTFPEDTSWCGGNWGSFNGDREKDINDPFHDYVDDNTDFFSNGFFNFIVMVVDEVQTNSATSHRQYFDLGLSPEAGCFLKFRYQMTHCFKTIG